MPKYYLQDKNYFHGSYMNWWAKDSKGYTANLDNAHQFTADEIAEMQSRGMRPTDVPWLCSYIDDKSARCVSATYCNYDEMKERESILLNQSCENDWISINDCIPSEGEIALVWNGHCVFIDEVISWFDDESGLCVAFEDESVTHWKPLPNPPQE